MIAISSFAYIHRYYDGDRNLILYDSCKEYMDINE